MHINLMPDLVLRRVFSKVPLQDLLNAGRVCPLWKYYQVETCEQVRSLTLLVGSTDTHHLITNSCFTLKYRDILLNDDGTRMYPPQHLDKHYHLSYGSFTSDGFAQLSNTFPHITTLEIAVKLARGHRLLSPMVTLLDQWSPVLKSLKMYFQFNGVLLENPPTTFVEGTNEFPRLFEVINSMQSLEHLTLDTEICIFLLLKPMELVNRFQPFNQPAQSADFKLMDLPILGRLREFYFKSNDYLNVIEESLKCYAVNNENLKQLGLDYKIIRGNHPCLPQLYSKIFYFAIDGSRITSTQVGDIIRLFPSITKLNLVNHSLIGNYANPFNGSLKAISSLQQLTHLQLSSYFRWLFHPAKASRHLLPQLATVQVLTFQTTLKSKFDFESDNWAYLFPNVQVIELIICHTSNCTNQTIWQLSKQELHQTLLPFKQCPKLHHIYTCEKYSEERGIEHLLTGILKEWILLQNRDDKFMILVKK